MKGQDKYINHNFGDLTGHNSWDDPGFEMLQAPGDSDLFGKISDFMKGLSDIEDVKNDPAYTAANDEVRMMISEYQAEKTHNRDIENFILSSMTEEAPEEKLRNEISQIKEEIGRNNINVISSEWVKEWNEKKQKKNSKNAGTEEIRNFIAGTLKEGISSERHTVERKRRLFDLSIATRYTSLAAAAVIAAVFLIRSLIPSDDPQKIFSKYYEPFDAASSVTRGTVTDESKVLTGAIANYKSGEYQAAAAGFTIALFSGTESISATFYLGITELELGNYDRAIKLLNEVANQKNTYAKEAAWYLGLAYIKSGNQIKASECFELLTRSQGFYSSRSEKILRLLR
jgi:tetratricopeptide (TPR) repeat protein